MRFICDVMLGKLAKYLRMLGIDTLYSRTTSEPKLLKTALSDQRTLLTRRTGLLQKKMNSPFYFVRSNNPKNQLKEVIDHYSISSEDIRPLTLCLLCNRILEDVDKNSIENNVPEYIFNTIEDFCQCPDCKKIYWQGSHYNNMYDTLLSRIYKQ